jgi:hypothetical protein
MATDYESVSTVMRDVDGYAYEYDPDGVDGIVLHGIGGIPRHHDLPRMGPAARAVYRRAGMMRG